jgi:DNA-binding MarR family transcriptional regulator
VKVEGRVTITVRQIPDYQRLCELSRRLPTLDPEAVYAFATTHAVGVEVEAALRCSLAKQGISEGRLRLLGILLDRPDAATHSELAEESGVTKGTITGLVDGLEREGYVQRQPDAQDRRVSRIALTPAGEAYLDKILPGHLSRLSRVMSGLSAAEQRLLVTLLRKLHAGLPALHDL